MSSSDLVVKVTAPGLARFDPALERAAEENTRKPLADGTRKAYVADWKRFTAFCAEYGLSPMPVDEKTIGMHLTALGQTGEFKIGTLRRVYTSIRAMHTHAGQPLPRLRGVEHTLTNLAKQLGGRARQAAPFTVEDLRQFALAARRGLIGVRDRALALLAFAAALRRSEVVSLDVEHLEFQPDGLRIVVAKSKTDQIGEGRALGVNLGVPPVCPVEAVRAWLDSAGIETGPVFRPIDRFGRLSSARLSDKYVDDLAKGLASTIGRDPKRYSGHSFRAGLATSAAAAGKSLDEIMRTTRHESEKIARGYIREGELFTRAANRGLMK